MIFSRSKRMHQKTSLTYKNHSRKDITITRRIRKQRKQLSRTLTMKKQRLSNSNLLKKLRIQNQSLSQLRRKQPHLQGLRKWRQEDRRQRRPQRRPKSSQLRLNQLRVILECSQWLQIQRIVRRNTQETNRNIKRNRPPAILQSRPRSLEKRALKLPQNKLNPSSKIKHH